MTERTLLASIDHQLIGTLIEGNGIWAFEYDPAWLENPDRFALSPHIPLLDKIQRDGATTRPIQWTFDNLLPEETVRQLIASDANLPDVSDAFALLERYGRESAGSVSLRVPGDAEEADQETLLRALTDEELNERIRNLPNVPLTHDAPKKMSLAGAQHKLAVVVRDGELFEPGGQAVSTHIMKPNHPQAGAYPHTVVNEWFIMQLARSVGLDVPDVARRYVPAPVYLITRFDREENKSGIVLRRHAIDGCQMLNLAATMKYSSWSVGALAELAGRCRAPAPARLRLFKWLVFCVLVGNGDSHLKNTSFLVDRNGITLAPFYDLLCEAVYETRNYSDKGRWPDLTEFTREVCGVQRYADFSRAVLIEAGEQLGLTRATATRQITELLARLPAAADALIVEVEDQNNKLMDWRPELRATLGGEMQLLRAIRHIVIQEMVARISA
ncbi:HipA domain-containing protein [Paraburkholderia sp. J8-2]|uniref:HipA domain-containing protein n=1 Tax=Paraburkholderia sp. J8-2 TaxID=2805440 RepID=UPI002AB6B170|nr:HipA domain-containing protein [Paraburkholderia sp. J8-2]